MMNIKHDDSYAYYWERTIITITLQCPLFRKVDNGGQQAGAELSQAQCIP